MKRTAGAGSKAPEARHWMRLTYACNNRCLFCLDGDQNQRGEPREFEEISRELRRARKAGIRRVVLSGGEPTLHPRFVDVVREASRRGFTHVQVITNGRRFCYPRFLSDCVEAGLREITFSLHGHKAALHDRLVGVKGAFTQALAGLIGALKVPGLIVSVDVVLNKLSIGELEGILRFYMRLGVMEFDLLQVIPFGRAWENWKLLSYDPGKRGGPLRKGLRAAREAGAVVWTNRLSARHLEGFEDLIQPPEKLHDEARGRSAMFLKALESGEPPACRGGRCAHCFIEGFCRDLTALRGEGSLRALSMPACLKLRRPRPVFRGKGGKTDLGKLVDFYIEHRYYVKGRACSRCSRKGSCSGAPIRLIREKGFKILRPFR